MVVLKLCTQVLVEAAQILEEQRSAEDAMTAIGKIDATVSNSACVVVCRVSTFYTLPHQL